MITKKLLTVLMSVLIIFNVLKPSVYADNLQGNATKQEISEAMNAVKDSLPVLGDSLSVEQQTALGSVFTSFMGVVTPVGQIVTAVNGSVNFLRMIGILNDPTQTKLESILTQLQKIDETLVSMDAKLDNITSMMSEIKASVEFSDRSQKAILYEDRWTDFVYNYMEDGLDKLISKYNSMIRSGLDEWCKNQSANDRIKEYQLTIDSTLTPFSTDNSSITVLYKNNEGNLEIVYTDIDGIPSGIESGDSYIIIPATSLPTSITYDVNDFEQTLASYIAGQIKSAISSKNVSAYTLYNFPLLTEQGDPAISDDEIDKLAKDAVNTLIYRIACAKINSDSEFALEVSRQYANYCSHLTTSGEGVDAILKTFFLTHAFEYEVKQDIQDFCDRMIINTGTYGMFAANVLGMSHLITNDERQAAVNQMTETINTIKEAKDNSVTGHDNYCYITGTTLKYTTVYFDALSKLKAHYTQSNTTYTSCFDNKIESVIEKATYDSVPIGDSAMIMLVNILNCNGVEVNHNYLNENLGNNSVAELGSIVTGYSSPQTLTLDGKTKFHVKNAFGSYFKNDSTVNNLPNKAESEYVRYRKKISGSLYNLDSKTLTTNNVLCAIASYGENHWYWITDEGGFMGGPSNVSSFKDSYTKTETGQDSTGKIREHKYYMSVTYNTIASTQIDSSKIKLNEDSDYKPLVSLQNDVDTLSYNINDYEEVTKPEINESKSNVRFKNGVIKANFTHLDTDDCVIDFYDEFSNYSKAVLLDLNNEVVTNCNVEKGSVKVIIPNDYIEELPIGVYYYRLCLTSFENVEHLYDVEIEIEEEEYEEPSFKIAHTGVE